VDKGNTTDGALAFDSALSLHRLFPFFSNLLLAALWITGASARVAFTSEPAWSCSEADDDNDDDEEEEEHDLDSLTEDSESPSALALHLPRMTVPSAALHPEGRESGNIDVDGESAWRMLRSAVRISGE
jgi:hypothetical protein